MSDMSEFLNVKRSDVPEPQVLPSCLVKCVVVRYGIDRQNNEKRTPFVLATLKPVEMIECDEEVDIENARILTNKFWRTPAADKIAVDFLLKRLKAPEELSARWYADEAELGELWEAAIGAEVLVEVHQGISEKSGRPYAEVVKFFPVD